MDSSAGIYFTATRKVLLSATPPSNCGHPPSSDHARSWPDCIPANLREHVSEMRRELASKEAVDESRPDNCTLFRFLIARNYDVKVATDLYIRMLRWREEFGADSIFEEKNAAKLLEGKTVLSQGSHKTDKWGHPVFFLGLDQPRLSQLIKEGTGDGSRAAAYVKYYVAELESLINLRFPACSKASGRHIDRAVVILDGSTLSLWALDSQLRTFLEGLSATCADNYPETLHKMFLINTPSTFKATWALVRPWLTRETQEKIKILGREYQATLLKDIHASDLPAFLGGSCHCQGEGGCLSSEVGPWKDPAVIQELTKLEEAQQPSPRHRKAPPAPPPRTRAAPVRPIPAPNTGIARTQSEPIRLHSDFWSALRAVENASQSLPPKARRRGAFRIARHTSAAATLLRDLPEEGGDEQKGPHNIPDRRDAEEAFGRGRGPKQEEEKSARGGLPPEELTTLSGANEEGGVMDERTGVPAAGVAPAGSDDLARASEGTDPVTRDGHGNWAHGDGAHGGASSRTGLMEQRAKEVERGKDGAAHSMDRDTSFRGHRCNLKALLKKLMSKHPRGRRHGKSSKIGLLHRNGSHEA